MGREHRDEETPLPLFQLLVLFRSVTRVSVGFCFSWRLGGRQKERVRETDSPLVRPLIGAFCGPSILVSFFCGVCSSCPEWKAASTVRMGCLLYGCSIMGRISTYCFERVKRCLDLFYFWCYCYCCVEPVRALSSHRWLYGIRETIVEGLTCTTSNDLYIADI